MTCRFRLAFYTCSISIFKLALATATGNMHQELATGLRVKRCR